MDEDELGPHPVGEASGELSSVPGRRRFVDGAHDSHRPTMERDPRVFRGVEAAPRCRGDPICGGVGVDRSARLTGWGQAPLDVR